MTDRIQIVQGRQADADGVKLALVNVFDGKDIRLSVAHGRGDAWVDRLALKRSDIFAAGGQFLRVEDIGTDAASQRATVTLAPFAAPAGIAALRAGSAVTVEGGELHLGDRAVRIAGAVAADGATLEVWPGRDPRERVEPAQVETHEIAVGDSVAVGGATLEVVRLQPAAGEVLGFVEFSKQP